MRYIALTLMTASLLGATATAHATWKWKDAKGVTHISDRAPPPSVPESSILARPAGAQSRLAPAPQPTAAAASAPAAPAAGASAAGKDPELAARQKKQEQAEQAANKEKEAKAAAARADNCKKARNYQTALKDGIRVAVPNAAGEREILDDKGRADEMRRTQETIDRDCK
jgi:hypothetical protein